jgi:hypothetical protein
LVTYQITTINDAHQFLCTHQNFHLNPITKMSLRPSVSATALFLLFLWPSFSRPLSSGWLVLKHAWAHNLFYFLSCVEFIFSYSRLGRLMYHENPTMLNKSKQNCIVPKTSEIHIANFNILTLLSSQQTPHHEEYFTRTWYLV